MFNHTEGRDETHDACAVCGTCVDCNLSDDTAAHYDKPFGTVIIAWTCGSVCTDRYEGLRAELDSAFQF